MNYYLIDTSAIVHYYIPSPSSKLTQNIGKLITEKQKNQSFLFIPNFCIAETYNTFAKYHFRTGGLEKLEYDQIREKFTDHVRRGKLLYQFELNRWHIMNVDYISPIEHQYSLKHKNNKGEMVDWFLSTFDILFLAMGIELVKIVGVDNLKLITCDERIFKIGQSLQMLGKNKKEEYGIPRTIIYPEVMSLWDIKT